MNSNEVQTWSGVVNSSEAVRQGPDPPAAKYQWSKARQSKQERPTREESVSQFNPGAQRSCLTTQTAHPHDKKESTALAKDERVPVGYGSLSHLHLPRRGDASSAQRNCVTTRCSLCLPSAPSTMCFRAPCGASKVPSVPW